MSASRMFLPVVLCFVFGLRTVSSSHVKCVPKAEGGVLQLENVSARCCVMEFHKFSYVNKDTNETEGFSIVQYNKLKELTGFECSKWIPFNVTSGSAYNAFVNYLSTCELDADNRCANLECDMGIGQWWETTDRTGVRFLPSHGHVGIHVVTEVRNIHPSSTGTFIFDVFDYWVWLAIAGLVCLFVIIRLFDTNVSPFHPTPTVSLDDEPAISRFRRVVLQKLRHLIRPLIESTKRTYRTTRQWLLSITIALSGLLLLLVYEASMTIADEDICFVKGDGIETFWENSMSNRVCQNKSHRDWPKRVISYEQLIESTAKGECKYSIMDGSTALEATTGRYCGKIHITGSRFHTRGVSFIVPKNWKYYEQLRVGQICTIALHPNSSMQAYLGDRSTCKVTTSRVGFMQLRLFFGVAYITCVVLIIYSGCHRQFGHEDNELEEEHGLEEDHGLEQFASDSHTSNDDK